MDYQKAHVKAIYPGTGSVVWNNGTMSFAKRAWSGKEQKALPVKGNPIRFDPSAPYLSKGVTLASQSIQAVYIHNVNEYLLVIVYRFTKLTLVVPIPNQDAETVVSAFLHTWVAA
eukprot:contig_6897_g1593